MRRVQFRSSCLAGFFPSHQNAATKEKKTRVDDGKGRKKRGRLRDQAGRDVGPGASRGEERVGIFQKKKKRWESGKVVKWGRGGKKREKKKREKRTGRANGRAGAKKGGPTECKRRETRTTERTGSGMTQARIGNRRAMFLRLFFFLRRPRGLGSGESTATYTRKTPGRR